MTPQQRSDFRAAIEAHCDALRQSGDYAGIVAFFSGADGEMVKPETFATTATMMGGMDPALAAGILEKFEDAAALDPVVKWALAPLTGTRGLDVGHPNTRAYMLALRQANVINDAERDALLALGAVPVTRGYRLIGREVALADVEEFCNDW